MTKPLFLLVTMVALFQFGSLAFGYTVIYQIGYGTFAVLALVISLTFFWLWAKRSTPLALGMAFSWGGATGVMSWWWLYNVFGRPVWMVEHPLLFVFLSVYVVGAILHLEVIGRSFALSRALAVAPFGGAVVIATAIALLL